MLYPLKYLSVLGFTTLLSVTSAAQAENTVKSQPEDGRSTFQASQDAMEASSQQLARGIALALGDPEVRLLVREAMQASPWNEHKLVLQQFVRTKPGRKLVEAASAALDLTPQALSLKVASLPNLDFYMAYREHRTTWQTSPEVLVGATFDSRAPALQAFDVYGGSQVLLLEDGIPDTPLIVLHPAEPKFRRAPASLSTSDLIESPQERPNKKRAIAASAGPGYYLYHYNIQEGDGWNGGDCEMEFRSWFRDANGLQTNFSTWATSGVQEDLGYTPVPDIFLNNTFGSLTFVLEVWEMDGGSGSLNGNDFYGSRDYYLAPGTSSGHLPFFENVRQPYDSTAGHDRSAWIGVLRR